MTSTERRLAVLESDFKKLLSKLKDSKVISEKDENRFTSLHRGEKTKEVIAQEMKSLVNQTKLGTASDEEINQVVARIEELQKEFEDLNEKDQEWVKKEMSQFYDKIKRLRARAETAAKENKEKSGK